MADKRRKTLIVCGPCHDAIHAGTPPVSHGHVTGELTAGETRTVSSAGGRAEKDQHKLAPRRAADPTSLVAPFSSGPLVVRASDHLDDVADGEADAWSRQGGGCF
jgi:hypothetical protein